MGSSFSWIGGGGLFGSLNKWGDNTNPNLTGTSGPGTSDTADFGSAVTSGAVITGSGTVSAITVETPVTFGGAFTATNLGNAGSITLLTGSLSSTNSFVNSGALNIAGGYVNSDFFTNAGTVLLTAGSLSNNGFFGDNGTVAVSGAGWLNATAGIAVADTGNGTLTVTNGGVVSDASGIEGNQKGTQGSATITGPGAVWWNANALSVGQAGAGILSVQGGGAVDATDFYAGVAVGSSATITVSGTKSAIDVSQSAVIGQGGSAGLSIQGGALLYLVELATIGAQAGSSGTVTVNGSGSQMDAGQALFVGDAGAGALVVQNAGVVATQNTVLGNQLTGSGTATVTGAGSLLEDWQSAYVGSTGIGLLQISNGGTNVDYSSLDIGTYGGANGTVTVSGAGSVLKASGAMVVGDAGSGTLTIQNGANAVTGVLMIGNQAGSFGELVESGAGSTLLVSTGAVGGNWSGQGGRAILDITSGATFSASGWTNVWGQGTVELAGGLLLTQAIDLFGTIFGAGTIDSASNIANYQIMDSGNIVASGGTLDLIGMINQTGTLSITTGAELLIQNSVAATQTVSFGNGSSEQLVLAAPSQMQATITGFSSGDTIELLGLTVSQLIYSAGVLTAIGPGGPDGTLRAVGTFNLEGTYSANGFAFTTDGQGNSYITLPATPSPLSAPTAEPTESTYLETNRFFAATSIWNTPISSSTPSSSIPGITSMLAGITSWNPTSGSVAIYYAQPTDPLVAVLYNPNTFTYVADGAWSRSGNPSSVEQQILATSSATDPIPANPYSTAVAGLTWNGTPSGLPASYNAWDQAAGQTLYMYVPAGALPPSSPDGQTVIIQPDGTAIELYSPIVLSTGQWVSSALGATNAMNGTGTGADNGRSASMIENYAGVLRDTDVTSGVIDHALALVVPQSMMTAAVTGPALAFDANSTGYTGTLAMGSHLALPSSLNLATLGLTTSLGMEIAHAAQTYGEFIVDTGGTGLSIVTQNNPTSAALNTYSVGLQSDLNTIFRHEVLLAH